MWLVLAACQLFLFGAEAASENDLDIELVREDLSLEIIAVLGTGKLLQLDVRKKRPIQRATCLAAHLLLLLLFSDEHDHLI